MATTRTYPNAPITEAGIHLMVQPSDGISVGDLVRCHEGEENSYPLSKELQMATGHFEMGPRVSAAASAQHVGFVYTSSDQRQVYQVRVDGFLFSRLAPYESWEAFCKEARRLWQLYRERLKPAAVTRVAVRYINRLDIPAERIEIKDYLRTMPEIGEGLPQTLAGYFMQLQIPMDDIRSKLFLNETIGQSPKSGCLALILDIDLFRSDDIPNDEESIWQMFETLRVRKNEVFEACITDRARELFA
jgi:uncharacterized protein (TIGR04255 family)